MNMKLHTVIVLALTLTACGQKEKLPEWTGPQVFKPTTGVLDDKPGMLAKGFVTDATSGEGIADVVVSDGINCVKTGADGSYYLPADPGKCRTVFVITPADYEPAMKDCIFDGYQHHALGTTQCVRHDFSLSKRKVSSDKFKALFVADIQINKNGQFYDVAKEFFKGVGSLYGAEPLPTYMFSLGDCVYSTAGRDAVSQSMEDYKSFVALSGVPTFNVIGNHDHFPQAWASFTEATSGYVQALGPVNYAVNIGKVHVVILDDMAWGEDATKAEAFYDGFNDETLAFLKNDLALVPAGKPVFVCLHVPITRFHNSYKSTTYRHTEFMNALSGRDVHVWYGHVHNNYNYVYNSSEISKYGIKSLESHSVVRSCGQLFQSGRILSADGIPWSVIEVSVDGTDIRWHQKTFSYTCPNTSYKAAYPDDVLAYGPNQAGGPFKDPDTGVTKTDTSMSDYVYCDPYMHDNLWKTPEWWENGRKVCDMEDMHNILGLEPLALWTYENIQKILYDASFQYRYHLFRAKPTPGVKSGEVHVTDRFGEEYVRQISW